MRDELKADRRATNKVAATVLVQQGRQQEIRQDLEKDPFRDLYLVQK